MPQYICECVCKRGQSGEEQTTLLCVGLSFHNSFVTLDKLFNLFHFSFSCEMESNTANPIGP